MTVVTAVETVSVKTNCYEYVKPSRILTSGSPVLFGGKPPSAGFKETSELIYGTTYTLADGEQVCIGLSDEVWRELRLPLDCLRTQDGQLGELRQKVYNLTKINTAMEKRVEAGTLSLDKFTKMNLWQRIKFVFNPTP